MTIYVAQLLGPVVQSIVSLTGLLVVKMITVPVNTIANLQVFLLKKNASSFYKTLLTFFFSKNISIYVIFNDQSFNDTLNNDIFSLNNWTLKFYKLCKINV